MYEGITVLKFHATWCRPCRIYAHAFERVTQRLGVKTQHIDVDADPQTKDQYGVSNIPMTVILKDGVEVDRRKGAMIERDLTTMIERAAL